MTDTNRPTAADYGQAVIWCARLRQMPIAVATIEEFFVWRRDKRHAAAFAEIAEKRRRT